MQEVFRNENKTEKKVPTKVFTKLQILFNFIFLTFLVIIWAGTKEAASAVL